MLIGDAYAFVGRVSSSGVDLAMKSAVMGADLVDTILRHHAEEKKSVKAMRELTWFIYRFSSPAFHHTFMFKPDSGPNKHHQKIKSAVISVLAGDIYGNRALVWPISLFKLAYYFMSLTHFRQTIGFLRQKRDRT